MEAREGVGCTDINDDREQEREARHGGRVVTTEGGSNGDNRGKLMSKGRRGEMVVEGHRTTTQMRQSLHEHQPKTPWMRMGRRYVKNVGIITLMLFKSKQ